MQSRPGTTPEDHIVFIEPALAWRDWAWARLAAVVVRTRMRAVLMGSAGRASIGRAGMSARRASTTTECLKRAGTQKNTEEEAGVGT